MCRQQLQKVADLETARRLKEDITGALLTATFQDSVAIREERSKQCAERNEQIAARTVQQTDEERLQNKTVDDQLQQVVKEDKIAAAAFVAKTDYLRNQRAQKIADLERDRRVREGNQTVPFRLEKDGGCCGEQVGPRRFPKLEGQAVCECASSSRAALLKAKGNVTVQKEQRIYGLENNRREKEDAFRTRYVSIRQAIPEQQQQQQQESSVCSGQSAGEKVCEGKKETAAAAQTASPVITTTKKVTPSTPKGKSVKQKVEGYNELQKKAEEEEKLISPRPKQQQRKRQ